MNRIMAHLVPGLSLAGHRWAARHLPGLLLLLLRVDCGRDVAAEQPRGGAAAEEAPRAVEHCILRACLSHWNPVERQCRLGIAAAAAAGRNFDLLRAKLAVGTWRCRVKHFLMLAIVACCTNA